MELSAVIRALGFSAEKVDADSICAAVENDGRDTSPTRVTGQVESVESLQTALRANRLSEK